MQYRFFTSFMQKNFLEVLTKRKLCDIIANMKTLLLWKVRQGECVAD